MLKFEVFAVGPMRCNCICLWDTEKLVGNIIDPGGNIKKIINKVQRLDIRIEAILHTHAHFDHIGVTKDLQDLWQCPAYLHKEDQYLIDRLDTQTEMFNMPKLPKPIPSQFQHGDIKYGLKVLHTPGHTPGSCSFLFHSGADQILLSGDTLFRSSVGLTDRLGGSDEQLVLSIQRELYTLSDETLVIPGHGLTTTIGHEANTNPCVRRSYSLL